MITDATITAIAEAEDQTVLAEFYAADYTPAAQGFDPGFSELRCAPVGGVSLGNLDYTRMLLSVGTCRRTTTEEANSVSVTLDNLDRVASGYESLEGFEGKILVIRLVSRSNWDSYYDSLTLFAGRCEKPSSGTRESVTVTAKGIIHTVLAELPRRKFQPLDEAGRTPDNVNFEGFTYMPQVNAGTTTYSARVKRGGLLGFLGFKKTVTKTLQYSSYSDLDAEKYLPVVLGRAQIAGTHLAYADIGTRLRMTTAFCEGAIEAYASWRTDDVRFTLVPPTYARLGYPANEGPVSYVQEPFPVAGWVGNGYYARTVVGGFEATGTTIDQVDPAPLLIITCLGMRVPVPDGVDWTTVATSHADAAWSDNPAAHARYLLTSTDYFKLDDEWLDTASFIEAYDYCNQIIFDQSFSDIIFTPNTTSFGDPDTEANRYLLSTGVVTPQYLTYLKDGGPSNAFLLTAFAEPYDSAIPGSVASPGQPIDPDDLPGGGSGANLGFYLRRRYTSNIVFTEQIKLVDALHEVIFVAARLYLTQDPQTGKLKLRNKKPADNAIATAAISTTTAAVDDVSPWISSLRGSVIVDPHTANSEIRTVTAAQYPSATHNAVTLTAPTETVVGFAGCDNASTPATATVTFTTVTAGVAKTITLDGVEIVFRPGANDTTDTCAGFLYGAINGHPRLNRRFSAAWTPGDDIVTITAKFGNLTLDSAPALSHVAPLTDPAAAPSLTAPTATGSLLPGEYWVGYTYVNARGETLISPLSSQVITVGSSNKRISVAGITPPAGATAVNWYCSPTAQSYQLRLYKTNDGSAHTIDLADLPLLTAALKPDVNRTGAEILRVEAVFADRAESRSGTTRSNVLKGSFKWRLGDRSKPVNRVDLKFRDSTQDFRLVELRLRDDAHIAKVKKINKFEVNGQAIDNWHQAYRIASGLLAELRDADFFYEWEADKRALLLEEGDVVAITDDGYEVYNLPVRIESIEFDESDGNVKASFAARIYRSTLYDDSVAERAIPVVVQPSQGVDFV